MILLFLHWERLIAGTFKHIHAFSFSDLDAPFVLLDKEGDQLYYVGLPFSFRCREASQGLHTALIEKSLAILQIAKLNYITRSTQRNAWYIQGYILLSGNMLFTRFFQSVCSIIFFVINTQVFYCNGIEEDILLFSIVFFFFWFWIIESISILCKYFV